MSHERPRIGRGNNWHHAFYNRSWYDTRIPLEVAFREHPALVVPMREDFHTDLHRDLDPPLKPNHDQMRYMLGALALWTPEQGRVSGIRLVQDEFLELAGTPGQLGRNARLIAENLDDQAAYMVAGPPIKHYPVLRLVHG